MIEAQTPRPPVGRPTDTHREALVHQLRARWRRQVTVVVAGAGFGKTTLLGQAWGDNEADPRGHDVWLPVTADLESGVHLARAIATAIGDSRRLGTGNVAAIASAMAALAPVDVCLILDDVHLIPEGSSGAELLEELVQALPPNGHLLLAGRGDPPLRLTRLLARQEAVRIVEREMAFADAEVAHIAASNGIDPTPLARLGGWPALVDLASRGVEGPGSSLLSTVAESLTRDQRRAIALLLSAGPLSDRLVSDVLDLSSSARELLLGVPMVNAVGTDDIQCHDLWRDVTDLEVITDAELIEVVRKARTTATMDQMLRSARDRGSTAVQTSVVDHTLGSMAEAASEEFLERWLDLLLPELDGHPTELLLRGSAMLARTADLDEAGRLLTEARFAFEQSGDEHAEVTAVGRLILHGRLTNDTALLGSIFQRVVTLYERGWTSLGVVVAMANAALLEAGGDFDAAMDELTPLLGADLDQATRGLTVQYRNWLAILAGRCRECIEAARANAGTEDLRSLEANLYLVLLDWFSGVPATMAMRRGAERLRTARHRFVYHTNLSMMVASVGAGDFIDHDELLEGATDGQADQYLLATLTAARELHRGDEGRAEELMREAYERLGPPEPLALGHLRRFGAYPFLLVPELAEAVTAGHVGPEHEQRLRVARSLALARAGESSAWTQAPSAGWYITSLPLMWSVEAALLARRDGAQRVSDALVESLDEICREPFRRRLRAVADGDDQALAPLAEQLATKLPRLPSTPLELSLLGRPRVRRDGVEEEISRTRVAQLFAVLSIDPSRRRDALIESLWPDKGQAAGQANLRTTLSHLRKVLEPDRPRHEPSAFLRDQGDVLTLLDLPELQVDVRLIRSAAVQARRADVMGDIVSLESACATILDLWDEPDQSVWALPGLRLEVERLRIEVSWAAIRSGELALIRADHDVAVARASQVLAEDPSDQRAHRLLIASLRSAGDIARARQAVVACKTSVPEPELEDATIMVMQGVEDTAPVRGM